MKRIIYSIYTNNLDPHTSATDFKKSQFEKYKYKLEESQKQYAKLCNADYFLHKTSTVNYNNVQFEKILLLEKHAENYDEILYLDFDVVPMTKVNYFEFHDMNKLSCHALNRKPKEVDLRRWLNKGKQQHQQNVYVKTCAKNAMLSLDFINGNDLLINTGVIGCNKNIVNQIDFSNKRNILYNILEEAMTDNLYPDELSKSFFHNNEVYLSYIVEKYNIPFINLGMPWNFILDGYCRKPSAAAHLLHHVNKEFEISFGKI
tara:strand:- start:655 stop:1434 length:780 start_codon:yes stop_codon:yes gene_type:complete